MTVLHHCLYDFTVFFSCLILKLWLLLTHLALFTSFLPSLLLLQSYPGGKIDTHTAKYYLPRMKTSVGQLSLKYIALKIESNITENLKSSSPYSFGKKYKKVQLSCQTSC